MSKFIDHYTGGVHVTLRVQAFTLCVLSAFASARAAGAVTLNYGLFINTILNFIIVAFAVFLLVRSVNMARRQLEAKKEIVPAAPTTKEGPYCLSKININARRCPYCTSQL